MGVLDGTPQLIAQGPEDDRIRLIERADPLVLDIENPHNFMFHPDRDGKFRFRLVINVCHVPGIFGDVVHQHPFVVRDRPTDNPLAAFLLVPHGKKIGVHAGVGNDRRLPVLHVGKKDAHVEIVERLPDTVHGCGEEVVQFKRGSEILGKFVDEFDLCDAALGVIKHRGVLQSDGHNRCKKLREDKLLFLIGIGLGGAKAQRTDGFIAASKRHDEERVHAGSFQGGQERVIR